MDIYTIAEALGKAAAEEIKRLTPKVELKPGRIDITTPSGKSTVKIPNRLTRSSTTQKR